MFFAIFCIFEDILVIYHISYSDRLVLCQLQGPSKSPLAHSGGLFCFKQELKDLDNFI